MRSLCLRSDRKNEITVFISQDWYGSRLEDRLGLI